MHCSYVTLTFCLSQPSGCILSLEDLNQVMILLQIKKNRHYNKDDLHMCLVSCILLPPSVRAVYLLSPASLQCTVVSYKQTGKVFPAPSPTSGNPG